MNDTLISPFDDDGLIDGLVALKSVRAGGLVAHEALVALQNQN